MVYEFMNSWLDLATFKFKTVELTFSFIFVVYRLFLINLDLSINEAHTLRSYDLYEANRKSLSDFPIYVCIL